MRRGAFETISEDVHGRLRDEVLGGALRPGSRLKIADLRSRFSVSVSVMREALLRLVEQDLVVLEANQGFSVRRLSDEDLAHLVEARLEVEPFALRLAVERGSLEWEAAAVAAHHMLAGIPRAPESEPDLDRRWAQAHRQFHVQLLAGCANPVLLGVCGTLFDSGELYRRWSSAAPGLRPVEEEHRSLLDATVARDAPAATDLLRTHISRTADRALQSDLLAHKVVAATGRG